MKYVFVDTDNGTATPTSPVQTSSAWPANSSRFNTLSAAVSNATVQAETDDLTFFCQGVAADTARPLISPSLLAASITVQGDLNSPRWDTTKYRIQYTGSALEALYVTYTIGNVTLKNLQVQNDGTNTGGPYAIRINATANALTYIVDSCIARIGCASGTAAGYGIRLGVGTTATAIANNCIAIKLASAGSNPRSAIAAPTSAAVRAAYNCIARGANEGFLFFNTVVNCVSFDNTTDFSSVTTVQYSASDDVRAGTGNINGLTWADQFVDYTNDDFTLKAGSSLIGAGIGPASDPNVPTTDIAGNTRSGTTTDIGAAIYVASGGVTTAWLVA